MNALGDDLCAICTVLLLRLSLKEALREVAWDLFLCATNMVFAPKLLVRFFQAASLGTSRCMGNRCLCQPVLLDCQRTLRLSIP
jgi:hypothetical protein